MALSLSLCLPPAYAAWDPDTEFSLGRTAFTAGNYDEAIQHFQEAYKANPKMIDAYIWVGNAQMAKGTTSDAEKTFMELIQKYPNDPRAYNQLGYLEIQRGNYAKAEPHLKKTVAMTQDNQILKTAYYRLGITGMNLEKFDEAREALQKVKAIDLSYLDVNQKIAEVDIVEADSLYKQATKILTEGEAIKALQLLERAIALNPRHQEAHKQYISLKSSLGDDPTPGETPAYRGSF